MQINRIKIFRNKHYEEVEQMAIELVVESDALHMMTDVDKTNQVDTMIVVTSQQTVIVVDNLFLVLVLLHVLELKR